MPDPISTVDWDELIRSLGRFGLGAREASLYLALLRRGRATASELAREVRVDRVVGYRILDTMKGRGIVEVTAERPRRYAPAPPAALFERVLRERRASLEADETSAGELARRLAEFSASITAGGARYQVLTGEARVYDYLREMVGRAKEEIDVMLTHRSLRESLEFGLQNRIGGHLASGGRFRLMLESDPRLHQLEARFKRVLRRFPRAEIRELSPQPSRLTIVDRSEVVVFLVPEARERRTEQIAIWSDSPAFVAGQRHYFDVVWASAAPVVSKGSPRTGKPRETR
jgi:sugar-specific transcriptional regulator TrmB